MDLNKIQVSPKKRTPWQAVDVGFKMATQWYRPLFILYALPFFLFSIGIFLVLSDHPIWAGLIIWWLKPLFERAPLFFVSRALFGEVQPVKTVFNQWLKILKFDWLGSLLWRRFSFTRSYDLPITLLEQVSGKTRAKRLRVLHQQGTSESILLTMMCFLSVFVFQYALIALLALLVPIDYFGDVFNWYSSNSIHVSYYQIASVLLTVSIIEPFYICAGFMLYINRRIELEAWDIEISFRNMLEKEKYIGAGKLPTILVFGALLVGSLTFSPTPVYAQSNDLEHQVLHNDFDQVNNKDEAKSRINDIFKGEDFTNEETISAWRLKNFEYDGDLNWLEKLINAFGRWFEKHFANSGSGDIEVSGYLNNVAFIIKALLISALLIVISILIYRYRTNIAYLIGYSKKLPLNNSTKETNTLFGLDVTQESLPENIPEEVITLFKAGNTRQAIGLLYRATLSKLMTEKGFRFDESYTEGECLAVVTQGDDNSLTGFISDMTTVWQQLAYGHVQPTEETLNTLCNRWSGVFSNAE